MALASELVYGAAAASVMLEGNITGGQIVSELLKAVPAGEELPKEALQLYEGLRENAGILIEFFRALDLIETEENRNEVDLLRVKVLSGLTMADVIRLYTQGREKDGDI